MRAVVVVVCVVALFATGAYAQNAVEELLDMGLAPVLLRTTEETLSQTEETSSTRAASVVPSSTLSASRRGRVELYMATFKVWKEYNALRDRNANIAKEYQKRYRRTERLPFASEHLLRQWRDSVARLNRKAGELVDASRRARDAFRDAPSELCGSGGKTCLDVVTGVYESARAIVEKNAKVDVVLSRSPQAAIPAFVIYGLGLAVLMTILVLGLIWGVIRKVSAPVVASLFILCAACALRIASNALLLNRASGSQLPLPTLLGRLASAVELIILLVLTWSWSAAAREMSRSEHSALWIVLRVVATMLVCASIVVEIVSSVVMGVALENPNLDGSWTQYGFLAIAIARVFLAAALLSVSFFVYHKAKRTAAFSEKVLPAFHRMLAALCVLGVSCVLFLGGDVSRVLPVQLTAGALFIIAMSIAYLSFFLQMRERVKVEDEDDSRNAALLQKGEGDTPAGLNMENYDY